MGSIYVRLHNGRQIDTSVPSGLYVNPNFWDSKQECVKLSSQCNEKERIRINKELWKLKSFLEEKAREDKDSGDRLIKGMAEKSSSRALYDLQSMGVDVILKTRVLDYKNGVVQLNDGREIPAKTVVWVSGIKANTIEGLTPESQGSVFANWMWNYVNYTQSLRLILKIEK